MKIWKSITFEIKREQWYPRMFKKLIVNPGIQVVPCELCYACECLREVILPEGIIKVGKKAFNLCIRLLEIAICGMVESIGDYAFIHCEFLTRVDFGLPSSSPHRLKTIGKSAFQRCRSLERINIPSSVNLLGLDVFESCDVLVDADLSTTFITAIAGREAYSSFVQYERIEATSILEMALWKAELGRGWWSNDNDGTHQQQERQAALD